MKKDIEQESNVLDILQQENAQLKRKIKALERAQLEKIKIHNLLENILDPVLVIKC